MDSTSQLTVCIITKVAEGKIDIVNASKLLNKSRRTVERYREVGIQFVVHRNTGNAPFNKTCNKLKRQVQGLIKKQYFDLNLTHLAEKLAETLGNVSEAARATGVSRDTIYRHRRIIKEGGIQALKRQIASNHHHQNRTAQSTADIVIEFSLENPHLGQVEVANQLRKHHCIELSASGVRNIWLREKMQTMALRLHRRETIAAGAIT